MTMKKITLFSGSFMLTMTCLTLIQYGCDQPAQEKALAAPAPKTLSHAELIDRGKYLVSAFCHDCHSPKKFTPMGPVPDSSRLLSGHPAGAPLPPIDKNALQPGNWMLIGPDLTSFAGPWGISYTANITPDSATGIGAWGLDEFIGTIRTGKHLGQAGGRPILPPMPWEGIRQYSDEDLKAIYTYLQSIPPVSNKVPAPTPPMDVAKMK
jgi:mono/diheme cytochrome c family protein